MGISSPKQKKYVIPFRIIELVLLPLFHSFISNFTIIISCSLILQLLYQNMRFTIV